ncbi:hypothetical protein BDK51DRAFT_38940 [Blyttiomyces helicus]|uniref:Uncharacterized protein n=1 Tax=Blyttiomyces helicus TaxID=388810 RepID=A0A4P9W581_9FUNG|nr:hypothetical protein BDK51DRAFT_38940 [Blyttiomyces helicus]|eukprot:RKO85900.1 hypothetical protein BDK51DRAFT_38940 [Blyttiomyces helicus]
MRELQLLCFEGVNGCVPGTTSASYSSTNISPRVAASVGSAAASVGAASSSAGVSVPASIPSLGCGGLLKLHNGTGLLQGSKWNQYWLPNWDRVAVASWGKDCSRISGTQRPSRQEWECWVFVAYGAARFSSLSPGSSSLINVGLSSAIHARGIPLPDLGASPTIRIPQTSCTDLFTGILTLPAPPVFNIPYGRSVPAPALGAPSSGTSTPPGTLCRSSSLLSSPAASIAALSLNLKTYALFGMVTSLCITSKPDTAE